MTSLTAVADDPLSFESRLSHGNAAPLLPQLQRPPFRPGGDREGQSGVTPAQSTERVGSDVRAPETATAVDGWANRNRVKRRQSSKNFLVCSLSSFTEGKMFL